MGNHSKMVHLGKVLMREVAVVGLAAAAIIFSLRVMNVFQLPPEAPQDVHMGMRGPLVSIGSHVSLQSTDFGVRPISLVLVSSPDCHFCVQSESFHRKLLSETQKVNIPFYIVVPERKKAAAYLNAMGFASAVVREWNDLNARVPGTPTIIAVDANNTAIRLWVGRLPTEVESDLLGLVQARALSDSLGSNTRGRRKGVPNYPQAADIRKLAPNGKIQVLDVHERGDQVAQPGMLILPFLQLSTRAQFELDRATLQVVDCTNLSEGKCGAAVGTLSSLGFQVATVGAGSVFDGCEVLPGNGVR